MKPVAIAAIAVILLSRGTSAFAVESPTGDATALSDDTAAASRAQPIASNSRMTLRLDNYRDVVESVLEAGSVQSGQQHAMPAKPGEIGTPISVDGDSQADAGQAMRKSLLMRAADPGVFAARSPGQIDEPLVVTTDMPLRADGVISWPMPTGHLSIVAADGSRIEVDANNGDPDSADVTITNGAEHHRVREPWTVWRHHQSTTR